MKVSVIVPVYNDAEGLERTLNSLVQIDFPRTDHEVIVVDNDSSDRSLMVAVRFADSYEHISVYEETQVHTSYAARNCGMGKAKGKIFAFIDADMTVKQTWLTALTRKFEEVRADYIGWKVEVEFAANYVSLMSMYDVATAFPVQFYMKHLNYAPTCCLAVHSRIVGDVGGFNPEFESGGDSEFGRRVISAGYEQWYAADISVSHPARDRLSEHIMKARRLGRGLEQRFQYDDSYTRPWYHLSNVLPPRPGRFWQRLGSKYSWSLRFLYYVIAYFLKMVTWGGRIEGRLTRRASS